MTCKTLTLDDLEVMVFQSCGIVAKQ